MRETNAGDEERVRALHLAAFDASERELVAELAVGLIREDGVLNLVIEEGGRVVGHVAFSPVRSEAGEVVGSTLAPLAVDPECQGRGIGGQLVREGLRRAGGDGVGLVFVYGDPAYYGRFGFTAEQAEGYEAPYALSYPHGWLALRREGGEVPGKGKITCVGPLCRPELW